MPAGLDGTVNTLDAALLLDVTFLTGGGRNFSSARYVVLRSAILLSGGLRRLVARRVLLEHIDEVLA